MDYRELQLAVTEGRPRQAVQLVKEMLDRGVEAQTIMDQGLQPAMHQLGTDYASSDFSIARILASARAMKRALETIEPYIEKQTKKGCAIIGTAGGDLHDVGKNIVAIMFESVGFEVIDLGVDVPAERFVQAVQQYPQADIVCISCLLTTSMPEVRHIVKALKKYKKKYAFHIMIGGAPVDAEFAEEIGADLYTENGIEAAERAQELIRQKEK